MGRSEYSKRRQQLPQISERISLGLDVGGEARPKSMASGAHGTIQGQACRTWKSRCESGLRAVKQSVAKRTDGTGTFAIFDSANQSAPIVW